MRWSRPPPAQKLAGAQGTTAIKPLIKSEISLIPQQPRNIEFVIYDLPPIAASPVYKTPGGTSHVMCRPQLSFTGSLSGYVSRAMK